MTSLPLSRSTPCPPSSPDPNYIDYQNTMNPPPNPPSNPPCQPNSNSNYFRYSNGNGGNGYQPISQFAEFLNYRNTNPVDPSNPLTYSIVPTFNSMFLHGASISKLNNRTWSRNVQNFMADYAAIHWDGFSEAYVLLNTDTVWANSAAIDIHAYTLCMSYLNYKPTQGEQMVRNGAERRFLWFPYTPVMQEPFDYTVANSPLVTYFTPLYNSGPCLFRNLDCPERVENDPLMRKVLEDPQPCLDVLVRIYGAYRNSHPQVRIQGTTLADYFEKKAYYFERAGAMLRRYIKGYDDPLFVFPPDNNLYTPCPYPNV